MASSTVITGSRAKLTPANAASVAPTEIADLALYGSATYGTSQYGGAEFILIRQPITGSGFAVAVQFTEKQNETSAPYSLRGFSLEFAAAGRR